LVELENVGLKLEEICSIPMKGKRRRIRYRRFENEMEASYGRTG
jgi:hypothetical protein